MEPDGAGLPFTVAESACQSAGHVMIPPVGGQNNPVAADNDLPPPYQPQAAAEQPRIANPIRRIGAVLEAAAHAGQAQAYHCASPLFADTASLRH